MAAKSLAFGDYIDLVQPSIYRGGLFNGNFFFGGNGIDYRFSYTNTHSALRAYESCPPLTAVVNRKAQCYINGKTEILNSQGKDATDTNPIAKKLKKLLRRPNPIQTWKQFEAQQYIYIQLFGFCVTLPIIPAGYESQGPVAATSLWNIPSYMLSISEKKTLFYTAENLMDIVEYIRFDYKGDTVNLPLDNLFIFKDFTPSANSVIFPTSRVKALEMPISNITATYMSRHELINFAGAQGLLAPAGADSAGSIPLKEDEKRQLQEDVKRQYGIGRSQWRYIIAPTAMTWTAIGKPTKDLMLFEEVVDDIMRICDGYNYPSPLLNSEKGPNVSNTAQYQAQIYTDGIIPESQDIYEQWGAYLHLDEYNLTINKNFNHIDVLQENKKEQGQALLYMNQSMMLLWAQDLITANQILEANEMDKVAGWDVYLSDFKAMGKIPTIVPLNNDPKSDPNKDDEDPKNTDNGKGK